MKIAILALAVLAVVVVASAMRTERAHACNLDGSCKVHDFKRVARASAEQKHKITIWTKENGFAASCGSMLMEISDPGALASCLAALFA